MKRPFVLAAAVICLAAPALAQHAPPPPPPAAAPGASTNLQDVDPRQFMNNPHMHAFFDLSKTTLGPGAPKPDIAAYEQKSFAIFRALGESMGAGGGAAMQVHLKLIPRQVVRIVKDDPHVLDSFEAFTDAMVGPE